MDNRTYQNSQRIDAPAITNAISWAELMRKVRGSVQTTYIDGNITAIATASGVTVLIGQACEGAD